MIPYGKHFIDKNDISSVVSVLKNKQLTQGKLIEYFEDAVKEYVGAKYAVAVSSGTAGLHLAYQAVNLKKYEIILVPAITFVSTANAGYFINKKVKILDTNPNAQFDIFHFETLLKNNPKIKLIVPVHFAGWSCDMHKIYEIAKKYNCFIVEDAAHALGSIYSNKKKVGSCFYSDMTVFSFHPVKTIATGEGGMILTNDKHYYKKLLRLRSHGINKLDDKMLNTANAKTNKIPNPWYYEMQELGYNYRMTDIQSALGISQLKKIDKFLIKRRDIYIRYYEKFKKFKNLRLLYNNNIEKSSCHLCVILIDFKKINKTRSEIMNILKSKNILTQVHYIPLYLHPYYGISKSIQLKKYPNSKKYYESCLSIPIFYKLKKTEQNLIIKILYDIIG